MAETVELERAYVVRLGGMGMGTDSHDLVICRPSELDDILDTMAWEHHEQWYNSDESDQDDIEDPECEAEATPTEYTPENHDKWDGKRSGGGSFMDDGLVVETWQALGYTRTPFEGSTASDCWLYIKRWNLPVCQAFVSWQMLEGWQRQIVACQDVIRALDGIRHQNVPHLPPLLDTQLKGAYAMAENEIKCIEANVQKVVARLKAL